jgi:hypothetical protein
MKRQAIGAFFLLLFLAFPAEANSGVETDQSPAQAMESETREIHLKRILIGRVSDEFKLASLARFVRYGDSEDELEKRLGRPMYETPEHLYWYRCGLLVYCEEGKVVGVGSLISRKLTYFRNPNLSR